MAKTAIFSTQLKHQFCTFVRKKVALFLVLVLYSKGSLLYGQSVYINTPGAIFQLTGGIGSCTSVPITNQCIAEAGGIFSLAIFKDTIYYTTVGGELKRFKVGSPASCESFGHVGVSGYNSMTIDKNGIIYLTDNKLIRFNPYTGQLSNLGPLPFSSAGDLFFFNGKLLLAGNPPGIYEININNPIASALYMSTNGIRFFGLISFPESCNSIRYYGLAPNGGGTDLVGLDLSNKVVTGTVCFIPLSVFDAASVTESGVNEGIIVTSLKKIQPCPPATTGSLNITAVPTVPGVLNYTLDNTTTNTTGIFSGIPSGNHHIRIISEDGCIKDTSFQLSPGLNTPLIIQKADPGNCDNNNGMVSINAASNHTPITYTLINTGITQSSGNFINMQPGIYKFHVADEAGCTADTSVQLIAIPPSFIQAIDIKQSHCNLDNGSITIHVNGNATEPLSSINNGVFTPLLQFADLAAGTYYIQVKSGANCYYDTTIVIQNIIDQKPQIQIQINDQHCFSNNGSISIGVTGNDPPYTFQFSGGGFSNQNQFINLAPGNYLLDIKNNFDCGWDTFAIVIPYPKFPVAAAVQFINPTCRGINDGSLTVDITGPQTPYYFYINGQKYNNGQTLTGLTEGGYNIEIENNEQCRVDSLHQALVVPFEQHCNTVYIPNAFTPNDDGINDKFQPGYSSFIKNLHFSIFNRYGLKIYEGRGSYTSWDGTYKGAKQPPGVYVYMVSYTDYYGIPQLQKGTLMLIR